MSDDATKRFEKGPDSNEDKTIIAGAAGSGDRSTVIKEGDETKMGGMPDMELLTLGAKLVIVSKQNQGQEFYLTTPELVIGRSDDCSLKLDYPGISRSHLRLVCEEKNFFIEDLGSKYGTFIGKNKIEGKTKLKPGDILQIGELTLKYVTQGYAEGGGAKKLVMAVCGVGIFLLLLVVVKVLFSSAPAPAPARESAPQTPLIQTQTSGNTQSVLEQARNLDLSGKTQEGLDKIASLFQNDPLNQEALALQKTLQAKMQAGYKIENARKLMDIGSLGQAKSLVDEVLALDPSNVGANELLSRIEKLGKSQVAYGLLKDAKNLFTNGDPEGAREMLKKVTDPALSSEVEQMVRQIDLQESTFKSLEVIRERYNAGDMDKALASIREALQKNPSSEDLKKNKEKIELLLVKRKEANQLFGGPSPFRAKPVLQTILDLAGDSHPFGKQASQELTALEAQSLVLAQSAYQEALKHYADGEVKTSFEQLEQLTINFPQTDYFKEIKNEIKVRIDNLAKALYRAAYVIEEKDMMKAKEIYQRLLNFVPDNYSYAKKVKTKIRG